MDACIDSVIAFIGAHQRLGLLDRAGLCLCREPRPSSRSSIPSTAILVGVGALVATGELRFLPIFLGASHRGDHRVDLLVVPRAGATATAILRIWPLRDHPELVQTRQRRPSANWGPLAIIIGHFFGPLRPVVFLLCGMALHAVPASSSSCNVVGCHRLGLSRPEIRRGRRPCSSAGSGTSSPAADRSLRIIRRSAPAAASGCPPAIRFRRIPWQTCAPTFVGIKSPNPFWLASAPPTDKEYNVAPRLRGGLGRGGLEDAGLGRPAHRQRQRPALWRDLGRGPPPSGAEQHRTDHRPPAGGEPARDQAGQARLARPGAWSSA